MKKSNINHITSFIVFLAFIFTFISCEKQSSEIVSNDGVQARKAYTDKGYTEIEVTPITKISCYFDKWDKTIMTPVSGLFEYYDSNDNWVASIDFGDGTCDEWATKTLDVTLFPEYPSGTDEFSVFDYK